MTGKQTVNIILAVFIVAAIAVGWRLLLPLSQSYLIVGVISVAEGIWQLVSAPLVRRGIVRARWVPDVDAWRGVGCIAFGLGILSSLILTGRWATAMGIAGGLVCIMALILSSRERSKNKES